MVLDTPPPLHPLINGPMWDAKKNSWNHSLVYSESSRRMTCCNYRQYKMGTENCEEWLHLHSKLNSSSSLTLPCTSGCVVFEGWINPNYMYMFRLYRAVNTLPLILCVPRRALRWTYFLVETKRMHSCEDVQLYSFIYHTYMFRLLLWPSSGCRTVRIQAVR
jgi:hypothetical protein